MLDGQKIEPDAILKKMPNMPKAIDYSKLLNEGLIW